MISVNKFATGLVHQMIDGAESLGLASSQLSNGATVIDAGVETNGSLEAGRLFAEICLGGLGKVNLCGLDFDGEWMPGVQVEVNHPVIACMASQYAGWSVKSKGPKKYMAMGSGPARALYCKEPLFEKLGYRDQADVAVLTLENRQLPPEEVAEKVAAKCGVSPERLYLLVAPTASIVGSVQVAARVVETGMHKMLEVGFNIHTVFSGFGTCPIAPLAKNDLRAMGRTNDGVLYGGRAWYTVQTEDEKIEQVLERLPSCASRDYGTPFYELFKQYDGDFYQIDPLLFSPAQVQINNVTSGRTFQAGDVNSAILRKALAT